MNSPRFITLCIFSVIGIDITVVFSVFRVQTTEIKIETKNTWEIIDDSNDFKCINKKWGIVFILFVT